MGGTVRRGWGRRRWGRNTRGTRPLFKNEGVVGGNGATSNAGPRTEVAIVGC